MKLYNGSGIVLGIIVSRFGFLFGSAVLSVFLAICSILELEAAISTELQHFGIQTVHFPWNLQHFGAQTFHVGWYFAMKVHVRCVSVCVRVYLGLVQGWFCFLTVCYFYGGLVWGLFRVGVGSMSSWFRVGLGFL